MIPRVAFVLSLFALAAAPARSGEASFQTCYARWSDTELVVGNGHFERSWTIRNGWLTARSLRDKISGTDWLTRPSSRPAPLTGGKADASASRSVRISARGDRRDPVGEESLEIQIDSPETPANRLIIRIFPAASGAWMSFDAGAPSPAPASANPAHGGPTPTGIEEPTAPPPKADEGDSLEDLELASTHLKLTQVTLLDQTDSHNELVFEREWLLMPNEAPLRLPGNCFFVENPLTGSGLLFVKWAPLPHARPIRSESDLNVWPSKNRFRLVGQGYPHTVLCYGGGRFGRIRALQIFQRQLRAYEPSRDGMLTSNTWGDRNRDARIREDFILKEIEAGARLGVDVVQIDDGWQKGKTANSARGKGVWNGYWAADPEFWQPDAERFPRGLAPVVKAARERGMKFGLWYGPDSSGDAANWQRDADRILELHRAEGIDYVKIDSVKATTRGTEANLRRFFDRILDGSRGRVVFNLDVTAEIRPGYFGVPDAGPIYLENRYTDFHRYWPHQTLRNLWKLSAYVDPLRLQMEFLNNERNDRNYPSDPLAPSKYTPDHLFATTMFANPLAFCEVSGLSDRFVSSAAPLVAVWKRERARWHGGQLLPIGNPPDGASWTGFASISPDRTGGYLLLFRELNDRSEHTFDVPELNGQNAHATVLSGEGTAEWTEGGWKIRIPKPLRYLWLKVESRTGVPHA